MIDRTNRKLKAGGTFTLRKSGSLKAIIVWNFRPYSALTGARNLRDIPVLRKLARSQKIPAKQIAWREEETEAEVDPASS